MNRPQTRVYRKRGILILAVGALAVSAGLAIAWAYANSRRKVADHYQTAGVRRADLFPTTKASGRLESAKRTIIECRLENISVGVRGQRLAASGASTLLSVIPEGTMVKRGDVLAVLDSADYDEMLRLQRITLERAQSEKTQADLDVDIAKMAVREFLEGTVQENTEDFEVKIFLARSDLERAIDRLDWSRRMHDKGYLPKATLAADAYRKAQLTLALEQQQSAFEVYKKYTTPRMTRELQGAVKGAEAILDYQQLRLARSRQRLEQLERQVENCTIRSPHDGMVIYANNADRQLFIEPGLPVYEHQHLFYLPDLSKMQVITMLHESVVDHIGLGYRAKVSVEGLKDRQIEGHVLAIAPMTIFNVRSDVQYYEGTIKLENMIEGLRPGMTAEVELAMPRRENVLAIPPEAVRLENGHDVCLVVHEDGLEHREVKLGQVTTDLAEVTAGLAEGEQIVLNPSLDDLNHDVSTNPVEPSHSETAAHGGSSSVVAALH
jgi:HlyD family secretion protein